MPNPYTGVDNDPIQQAQHRFTGPEWEKYFAALNGKNVRMVLGPSLGGSGELRPGDLDTARSNSINAYLGDVQDQRRVHEQSLRGMTAGADIATAQARDVAQAQQDQEQAARAFQTGGDPARGIVNGPDGSYTTTTPAGPVSLEERRANILKMMPPEPRARQQQQWTAADAKQQELSLADRKQTEVERENRAKDAAAAPFVTPMDASGAPLMGDAMLKTLPAAKQKLVTAVLEGRQAIPSGTALKDPYWKGVLETANLIDPNFDTVNYNARANARKDFTSGKAAGQVNAINTVIGHLHDLADTGTKLDNGSANWINAIRNKLTTGGSERGVAINNFETLKEGVATELMRTWRQVGAGSEKEIEDWKAQIGSAKSPQELQGAFKTIGGMLESKLDALDNQYKQGMGTDKVTAITPESRKRLDALQGIKGGAPAGGGIVVKAPDGSEHPFDTQAQADAFKKLAGIK